MSRHIPHKDKDMIFIILISSFLFLLSTGSVHAALPVIMGDQGSDVRSISTRELLALGNLSISIYDDPFAGNLIYQNNFTDVIKNGSWNVMLYNVSMDFGRNYYKDYSINGDDLDFSGEERLAFTSSLGEINISSNITLGQKVMFALGAFIQNIIPGWLQIDSSVNISNDLEVSGNANIVGDLTVNGIDVCLSDGTNCLANVSGNVTYVYNNITNNITYNITQNVTNNVTNNYYTNLTYNFTENITTYVNLTNNVTYNITNNYTFEYYTNITNNITNYVNNTYNITQNVTYNITNNVTNYVNTTYNITNNITTYVNNTYNLTYNITNNYTTNVTYNITNNVTYNITNNVTYNITQNITYNITQNITYNISNNYTNNITYNITQNVTYNITYNITNNYTTNVTYNLTNNITYNLTQNVTYNATYNVTYNITNNFTEYVNNTYNITNNVTYNITNNVTYNITNNVTYNATYNVTYNVTNNITNYVNNTYNITNNVTQNVTYNITNNITYNITNNYSTGVFTVQSMNLSYIAVSNGSVSNFSVNLSGFDARYLLISDQRYNSTSRIDSLNSSKLQNSSSANLSSLVVVNNVSAYYIFANVNASYVQNSYWLNQSDQKYNETSRVNNVNSTSNIQSLGFNTTAQLDSRYSYKGEYFNITYNITQNVTYNTTYNVTYNVTNNITNYVNNTYNITNNVTQNVTYNITNNITNNFTEYVNNTYNITNNVTYNATYNVTYNITNNITNYVNNTYNVTYNITNNITQNVTYNITQNITNNITYNITNNYSAGVFTVQSMNLSYLTISNGSVSNFSINLSGFDSRYLSSSDQRYNDTSTIAGVNSTSNIQGLGFNTTTQLKSYFDSLYVTLSGVVSLVGNWSADKSNYNTTSQLSALFLNQSDQRFNDSSRVDAVNSSVQSLVSSNVSVNSRIDSLNSSKLQNSSSANLSSLVVVNNVSASYVLANVNASYVQNYYWLNQSDQRYNDTVLANSRALPGTCGAGQAVQNTTTGGVECVPIGVNGTSINITNSYVDNLTVTDTLYFRTFQGGIIVNGTYYDGTGTSTARSVATAFTASTLRCNAFPIGKGFTTDAIGFRVATANSSTSALAAFYLDNGNGYPGTLVLNGTVVLSATGFITNSSFGTYAFQPNTLYWACFASSTGGNQRVNVIPVASANSLGITTSGTTPNLGYTVAYTWGNPLPNPYTAGATYFTSLGNMAVYARVRTDI